MTRESKVVSLHQHNVGLNVLPMPLIRLRDKSAGRLRMLLGDLFDEADDALFAMSDKAGSDIEQAAYFDAMRELRMQRKSLTLSFLQWVGRAFNEVGRYEPRRLSPGHLEPTSDCQTLSLLDDGALEEQVALDNMITRVRSQHNEQILLLHTRIEHLIQAESLTPGLNPLGPEVICQGLGEACADLDVDIRAKLVIFKLFDKLLLDRLALFYEAANRELAQDGILPELRRPPGPSARRPPRSPSYESITVSQAGLYGDLADSASEGSAATTTFAELTELLHRSAANSDLQAGGVEAEATVSTACLLQLLGGVQGELQEPETGRTVGADLQKLVGRLVDAQSAGVAKLNQVDTDVINLVSMLFEFILEDRQLPEAMKSMLARLQLPILRVALQDRSFFDRGGHPARKLLNEIAMAAVGWEEKNAGEKDPLRDKIECTVARFVAEFERDIGIIQCLLEDFQHFMDLERRRALVEQRFWDAEEGGAKRQQARSVVDKALAGSRDGYQIPEVLAPLIEAWSKVLHWLYLREGDSGEQWQRAMATTDLLFWSVDPRPINDGTRTALLKALPQAVDAVREGLRTIGWDPFATDRLIRELETVHREVLKTIVLRAEETAEASVARLAQAPLVEPETGSLAESGADALAGPEIAGEPAVMAGPEPIWSGSGASTASTRDSGPRGASWMQHAEGLRVGSWLELQDGEARKQRCKLAAVIKATGKYIFVNRNGAKVAEYLLSDVAQALAEGRLTMLDDGLIFDRALESVIGNLRSNRRD